MSDDATATAGTTPEAEGSETTPEPKVLDPQEQIASARKRQAGAEAARQAAEAKAADLEKQLATYRQQTQTAEQAEMSELAREKALREQAEARAADAENKASARILDARFPNARKELPEVTDEVKLAKFEAMLSDDQPEPAAPTPQRHNESKTDTSEKRHEPTAADIEAELMAMPIPEGWVS